MKVHVVTERLETNRILPRMAKYLAEFNGWTFSTQPDPNADVNYWCNYLTWYQHSKGWHLTKTGAYFTHRDTGDEKKKRMWDDSVPHMDFMTVTCKSQMELLPKEKTFLVRPPVEIVRFTIAPIPAGGKPIVGTSGYVYGDNRKGEHLIAALARAELAQKLTLKASGQGWPIPTQSLAWNRMPGFFQSLSVYVCSSLYEGACMPPLEALACGVKVVIPKGVGMLDSLPDLPGIYRYERGDAKGMIQAVEEAAFSKEVDRAALRKAITRNYTAKMWAADHRRVVGQFAYKPHPVAAADDWHGKAGIYTVAFGEPSRACARRLIASVKKYMPRLPVCLVSDRPLKAGEAVFVKQADKDIGGRIAKLKAYDLAPKDWQYVLYLDADTEVVADISFLFQILADGWELTICRDMAKYATADQMARPDNKEECAITWDIMGTKEGAFQYNGGMMSFRRCEATAEFFKNWQKEWQKFGKRDQAALLRALYLRPVRLFLLMNQWNASMRYEKPPGELAIIHHNTKARRWEGIIPGRIDSPEAWERVRQWQAAHPTEK